MAKNIEVTLTLDTKKFSGQLAGAKRQMSAFGGSAGVAKGSIIGLAARFAPLAAAAVGVTAAFKGLTGSVAAAKKIEDIGIVLNNIVGSAEGGAAALAKVQEIATQLPFDLEQIAGATPALATVSKTIGDLEDNIILAADIAASTGLSFEDSASQIQRAFAGGAGAADLFREKGVLAMAGFQAGASYSIEETQRKFKEFGKSVEGAAEELNKTLGGSLSQQEDRIFQFQAALGSAIVPEFTAFINQLVGVFDKSKEEAEAAGKAFGEKLVNAFYKVLEAGAVVVDFMRMLFKAIQNVAIYINENFGEVIATVFGAAVKIIGGVVEAVAFLGKGLGKIIEMTTGETGVIDFFQKIEDAAKKVRKDGIEKVGESLKDVFNVESDDTTQKFVAGVIENMKKFGEATDAASEETKKKVEDMVDVNATVIKNGAKDMADSVSDFKTAGEELLSTFSSATEKLGDDIATALLDGQDAMGAFKDFFKVIVKDIIAQALRLAIIQPILSSIFGAFGYNIGFTGSGGIESITKRQMGGPIMKNKPYLVGEAGPELIVPSGSGSVVSNSSLAGMGGGTAVTYNINAVDARSFKQLVAEDPEFIYSVTRLGERRLPA
jgi:uncharacterized protein YoxC